MLSVLSLVSLVTTSKVVTKETKLRTKAVHFMGFFARLSPFLVTTSEVVTKKDKGSPFHDFRCLNA